MAERTTGDPIQRQHGKADTTKSLHTAANGSKHTPHLSLASLVDDRLDDSTFSLSVQNAQPRRSRSSVVQKNPIPKCSKSILSDVSRDLCTIYLVNLKTRMEQSLCHGTIVGNDQKPLRIGIQPTNRIEARGKMRQKIQYCSAPPIIICRRETALRFMEQNIKTFLIAANRCAVHSNLMPCCIVLAAKRRDGQPIDCHTPSTNERLCSTPGCRPCIADDFLQSFFHRVSYRTFTDSSPISSMRSSRTSGDPSIQ